MKKSFHFDIGNTNTGPLGLCARVVADTKKEAVELLRRAISDSGDNFGTLDFDDCVDAPHLRPGEGVEYIQMYFNTSKITAKDIDDDATDSYRRERVTEPPDTTPESRLAAATRKILESVKDGPRGEVVAGKRGERRNWNPDFPIELTLTAKELWSLQDALKPAIK